MQLADTRWYATEAPPAPSIHDLVVEFIKKQRPWGDPPKNALSRRIEKWAAHNKIEQVEVDVNGFEELKASLMDVATDKKAFTDEFIAPSIVAFALAYDLIHEADAKLIDCPVPPAMVSPDGEGGLSFTWRKQNKDLLLVVYEDGRARLHRALNSVYDVGAATPSTLAEGIRWFNHG